MRWPQLLSLLALTLLSGCSRSDHPASAGSPASMNLIALLTDFGWQDPYVGQMKGAILTVNPAVRLLDITHSVTPFDVEEGAYLLDQSAVEFPAGTVFVAVVDPGVGTNRESLLLKTNAGKFYVGPNNGLFSLVLQREGLAKAWKLDKPDFFHAGVISATFYGRDVFGPVAAHLTLGVAPENLGTEITKDNLVPLPLQPPALTGRTVSATLIHIDRYGNLITNLSRDDDYADRFKEGSLVKITLGGENYSAPLVKTYADVPKGRVALLYGSSGLLEICVNQGSAEKELKATVGVTVYFHP